MKKFSLKKTHSLTINITSLIDVVFILVVFFMISSSFEKSAIPVSLPSSQAAAESRISDNLIVTIDKNGNIFSDNKIISIEQIKSLDVKKNALLYCDESVSIDKIINVIDELTKSGVENVALKTHAKN